MPMSSTAKRALSTAIRALRTRLLDELLSLGPKPVVRRMDLKLRSRAVATVEEIDALVTKMRERLIAPFEEGGGVRLAYCGLKADYTIDCWGQFVAGWTTVTP